jgi:hypothetical protein
MAQHSFTMAAADGFVQNKSGTIRMLDLWLRGAAELSAALDAFRTANQRGHAAGSTGASTLQATA